MRVLRVLRNTGWNLAGQGVSVFAALVAIPLLIQELGESRFGILALGWLVTGYFAMFDLGIGRSAIRQMVAHGGASPERRANVFRTSVTLHALLGLLGGVLLGILAPWLASTALAIPLALATEAEHAFLWLAASVPFVEAHGYLGGTTMPNAKGLFPHERFNLEAAMHGFLAAGSEYRSQVALPGASPVPATAEGYVNFGWPGFVLFSVVAFASVVVVQEILLRLRARFGAAAWALSAWYGYLAFTLMTTTVFATFISLIHTVLAAGVLTAWYAIDRLLRWVGSK